MEKVMTDLTSFDHRSGRGAPLTPTPGMQWYVVHAYSGMEKAVERNITERIVRAGMESAWSISVPTEEVVGSKWTEKTTERRFFPVMCWLRW
jgi:transcriptional antiterminator NusG